MIHQINDALSRWLIAIDSDTIYMVLDMQSAELRLMHQKAVLRRCPAALDSIPSIAIERRLQQRIRRYWQLPSTPDVDYPFDWEDYLARDGDADCALYFSDGMLIYASDDWGAVRAPAVRLSGPDLRALYNACQIGLQLLTLPPGWNFVHTENEREFAKQAGTR